MLTVMLPSSESGPPLHCAPPMLLNVMSICMQFAPYQLAGNGDWQLRRDELATIAVRTLERHAPGIWNLIEHRQVWTPGDLEDALGLTHGHILHGEPALDQLFTMRPLLGYGQHRTPIRGLYLCGSGSHPGTGLTGGSGANAAREIARDLS